MKREELRENIFLLLYRYDFYSESGFEEQISLFFEEYEGNVSAKSRDYITNKVQNIVSRVEEIDKGIDEKAVSWSTKRMGKVELSILRLAYYEMKFDDEIPEKVAVDQAVELAKKYGSDESPRFVNGILAKLF